MAKFGRVSFGDLCLQIVAMKYAEFIWGGYNAGPILSLLWTKVYFVLRRSRRPLILSNALT